MADSTRMSDIHLHDWKTACLSRWIASWKTRSTAALRLDTRSRSFCLEPRAFAKHTTLVIPSISLGSIKDKARCRFFFFFTIVVCFTRKDPVDQQLGYCISTTRSPKRISSVWYSLRVNKEKSFPANVKCYLMSSWSSTVFIDSSYSTGYFF